MESGNLSSFSNASRPKGSGFTMLEVTVILILLGVLSAAAINRIDFLAGPTTLDVETAKMIARISHARNMGMLLARDAGACTPSNSSSMPCLNIKKNALTYTDMPPLPGEGAVIALSVTVKENNIELCFNANGKICKGNNGQSSTQQTLTLTDGNKERVITVKTDG